MVKDNFSRVSRRYARFRPTYPPAFYDLVLSLVSGRDAAWDCGTGNGQVAAALARHFASVVATDISNEQIASAVAAPNIRYLVASAEATPFPDAAFDLVTAAQAVHWFDLEKFFAEAARTLKPGGVIALIGYSRCTVDARVDRVVSRLYSQILDGYWDAERKLVDNHYRTIPFPFAELASPELTAFYEWSLDDFAGYLGTWSAVQHYRDRNGVDPIGLIAAGLAAAWGNAPLRSVSFPMFVRTGRTPA